MLGFSTDFPLYYQFRVYIYNNYIEIQVQISEFEQQEFI